MSNFTLATMDWQTPAALAVVGVAALHLVRLGIASWRGQKPGCSSCSSGQGSGCGAKTGAPRVVTLGGLRPRTGEEAPR